MARTRLIGNFGKFATGALGSLVDTGVLVDETLYIVATVGGSSALPAGVAVGYPFTSDGTEDITSSGDEVYPMTLSDLCDIQSWSLDFQADETEVTVLCDDLKKYIAGRTDVSGSAEGVFTIGITDGVGGFANSFIDIVKQADDGGAVTISYIDNDPIYAVLIKQSDDSSGETVTEYIAPVTVTSFSDSVSGSDAQAFNSSFRITNDDIVTFCLYENTKA